MNNAFAASIERLRKLYEGYDDAIHDFSHSERVAANARAIADDVGYQDKDFVAFCSLWHDAARTQGIGEGHEEAGAVMAQKDLAEHGVDVEIAARVYEAIRFHKSTSNPTTIEGKIVRDADKLDIFEVERWQNCAAVGWTKEYADDLRKTAASHGKYPDAFTYDFTKEQFKKRLPNFLSYYQSVKDQLPE